MTRIASVLNAYDAFSAYVNADNRAKWAMANPLAAKLCGWIEKQRFMNEAQ